MVGVYILLAIVVTLQTLSIILQITSGNVLLRMGNQLKDITIGLSAVLDRTRSATVPQRSQVDRDAGLIDVDTPQKSYDPRFEGSVAEDV